MNNNGPRLSEITRLPEIPRLVDIKKFKESTLQPKVKKPRNINKIILYSFLIFTFFFLLNCRFGFLKPREEGPSGVLL